MSAVSSVERVVQFTGPRQVEVAEHRGRTAARSSAGPYPLLGHLGRHRTHRLPRHQPVPDPDLGPRAQLFRDGAPGIEYPVAGWGCSRSARSWKSPRNSPAPGPAGPRRPGLGHLGPPQRGRRPRRAHDRPHPADRARTAGRGLRPGRRHRLQRRPGRRHPPRRGRRRVRPGRHRPAHHPPRPAQRRPRHRRRRPRRPPGDREAAWRQVLPQRPHRRRRRTRPRDHRWPRRRPRHRDQRCLPGPARGAALGRRRRRVWWPPASTRATASACASATSSTTTGSS